MKRLDRRLFRRRRDNDDRNLLFHGFLEAVSKSRYPVSPHFHIVVRIPQGYEDRFNKYVQRVWRNLAKSSSSIDVRPISDFDGLGYYITKFCHNEYPFIGNLYPMQ